MENQKTDWDDPQEALKAPAPDIYKTAANQSNEQGELLPFTGEKIPYIGAIWNELYQEISDPPKPIKTGFNMLDKAIGGLYNGVSVIGGMSGKGKTSIICQIVEQVAQSGVKVVFLSLEDPRRVIGERISAIIAKKKYNIFNNPEYWINEVAPEMANNSFFFQNIILYDGETIQPTPRHIAAAIKGLTSFLRKEHGEEQEILFIIDYLQYIEDERQKTDEYQTVTQAFKSIEKTAKENKIKVLLVSQLNRVSYQAEKDGGGIEQSAFRGSSRVENGAVLLMGITENKQNDTIRLNIAKNRNYKRFQGFIEYDFNGVFFTEKTSTEPLPLQDNETQSGGNDDACFD